MKRTSAFTLIELLVVMAIIAVLAAIIVPKISGAKARAERLSCASNMKGIVRGMQMYEEDFQVSCVRDAVGTETTLRVFGRLYYMEDDSKTGDKKMGITTPKIYNCPVSQTTPPTVNGYKSPFTLAGDQGIDYGIVITGNTPSFQTDPDKNAILIELDLGHHNGRNVAFWDSTVQFFKSGSVAADYPNNVNRATGSEDSTKIYAASQVIKATVDTAALSI